MPEPRMILTAPLAIVAALVAVATVACVVGPHGEFESVSGGGTGGTGAGTTGTTGDPFAPDPVACDAAPECGNASDCCSLNQPPVSLVPYACASDNFPNNWRCVASESGVCKQQWASDANPIGCDPAITDQTECRVNGFTCHEINGIGHCVATCTTNADCTDTHGMPHATCETVDGVDFCMHVVP